MNEQQRRRQVAQKIIIFNISANIIGYFLVGTYSAIAEGKNIVAAFQAVLYDWRSNLIAVLLLLLALATIHHATAPLRKWYLESLIPAAPSRKIRSLAVNAPLITASIALLAWSIRGVFASLLASANPLLQGNEFIQQFAINILSGGIAASIAFFGTERLWQPELGIFFPNGHVAESASKGRLSLRIRMIAFLVLGNLSLIVMALLTNQTLKQPQSGINALQRVAALQTIVIAAALITSTLLALTLIDSLLKAVQDLLDGMKNVQQGYLDTQVKIYLPDEFSRLADGFNDMVAALRQEETIRSLLDKYVTPEVAQHVLEHGAQLGGQQVNGTILFADLRDFTHISTQLSPKALMSLINQYFNVLNEAVIAHDGIINKFGGDSLLAVWVPPFSTASYPARAAIETAQDMFYRLDVLNHRLHEEGLPSLRIGIGIASGSLVVGHVGNAQRMEFTIIGASVNLASRLQTLTKELQIPLLFDPNTAQQAREFLAITDIGLHTIRGWDKPLSIYTLAQYAPSTLAQKTNKILHRIRHIGS